MIDWVGGWTSTVEDICICWDVFFVREIDSSFKVKLFLRGWTWWTFEKKKGPHLAKQGLTFTFYTLFWGGGWGGGDTNIFDFLFEKERRMFQLSSVENSEHRSFSRKAHIRIGMSAKGFLGAAQLFYFMTMRETVKHSSSTGLLKCCNCFLTIKWRFQVTLR